MAISNFVSSSQAETLRLGSALDAFKTTAMIEVEVSANWVGALNLRKRVASAVTFFTSSYTKEINGTSDNAPITGSGIFSVAASGCELQISHNMTTSGSVVVSTAFLNG